MKKMSKLTKIFLFSFGYFMARGLKINLTVKTGK